MEILKILIIGVCAYLNGAASMEYTSRFTVSDCSSTNENETDWSQFDDVAIVTLDDSSVLSQLEVSTEDLCITSCYVIESCVAIQVNTTTDGMVICTLLSYTPSIGKVGNQTGIKLLFKGDRRVYNIDTDVSTQCDGFTDCSTLVVEGNVYLAITDRHYGDISEAKDACLSMPTKNGGFDLAILDTSSKITVVKTFISTLASPPGSDVWLYIGGEAGVGISDPANKWSRTGTAIDPNLWGYMTVGNPNPNSADQDCVMITNAYIGLLDVRCNHGPDPVKLNTLCEYFPD